MPRDGTPLIDPLDCYTEPRISRHQRTRQERNGHPVYAYRVAYVEAHEIDLTDLDGYAVYMARTYCGTPGCMNPKHWKVAPRSHRDPVPMPPWWLDE